MTKIRESHPIPVGNRDPYERMRTIMGAQMVPFVGAPVQVPDYRGVSNPQAFLYDWIEKRSGYYDLPSLYT